MNVALIITTMAWQALPSRDLNPNSSLVQKGEKAGGLDPNSHGICPYNPYTHHSVELMDTPRKVPERKWKKCGVGDAGSSFVFIVFASSWKLVFCA